MVSIGRTTMGKVGLRVGFLKRLVRTAGKQKLIEEMKVKDQRLANKK